MEVGAAVARRVLDSDFAGEGPRHSLMHARLNRGIPIDRGWASLWRVSAPPMCWEALSRWALRRAGDLPAGAGTSERNAARSLARLAARIEREIDSLCAHPAYRHLAVLGTDPTVLPAFRVRLDGVDDPDLQIAPTPLRAIRAVDFAVGPLEVGQMIPYGAEVRHRAMTFWLWSATSEGGPAAGDGGSG